MVNIADLLERNKSVEHIPIPYIDEILAMGIQPGKTLIITCVDPRCMAEKFFNLNVGDCGTLRYTNENMSVDLKARVKEEHWSDIDKIDLGGNVDIEQSVRSDLEWARASPLIREELKKGIQGFVFDIKTGEIKKVGNA